MLRGRVLGRIESSLKLTKLVSAFEEALHPEVILLDSAVFGIVQTMFIHGEETKYTTIYLGQWKITKPLVFYLSFAK